MFEWQIDTVAFYLFKSKAKGRPTMLDRPHIVILLEVKSVQTLYISLSTPRGVHDVKYGSLFFIASTIDIVNSCIEIV